MLTLITGPMKAEKTGELNRLIKRATIANKNIKIFYPASDTRAEDYSITSRNGTKSKAVKIHSPEEILLHVEESDDIIFIDELQLWNLSIESVIRSLIKQEKQVICSGLDLDFKEEPFEITARIMCLADNVVKLTSICEICGSDYGRRTTRFIDNEPASFESPLFLVDGMNENVEYKTLCVSCYNELYKVKGNESRRMLVL